MKLIHFSLTRKTGIVGSSVVGIGKFDGVHLGHSRILRRIVLSARSRHVPSCLVTFKSYPVEFFLYNWEEKLSFLEAAGIDICLWADFEQLRNLAPGDFLEKLFIQCRMQEIVIGKGFRFGRARSGSVEFLKEWGKKHGVRVSCIAPAKIGSRIISSTVIRTLIRRGDMEGAARLLGRPYSLAGHVVKGDSIGSKLGFPTANIQLRNNVPLKDGVYAAVADVSGRIYKAVVFCGSSPTFSIDSRKFEVHIPGFSASLYNKNIRITLMKRLRPVRTFKSSDALRLQIAKDINSAVKALSAVDLTERV